MVFLWSKKWIFTLFGPFCVWASFWFARAFGRSLVWMCSAQILFHFSIQFVLHFANLWRRREKNAHKNDRSTLAIRMKMSIICSNISRQMFNVTHTLTEMQKTPSWRWAKNVAFSFAFFFDIIYYFAWCTENICDCRK